MDLAVYQVLSNLFTIRKRETNGASDNEHVDKMAKILQDPEKRENIDASNNDNKIKAIPK